MVEGKALAIVLLSAPYGNQYADHMCRVARRALEKGHSVEIFLYGDGVHAQMSEQSAKDSFPVGSFIQELIEKGAKVYSSQVSSVARGYPLPGNDAGVEVDRHSVKVMDGVRSADIADLVEMISRADRVLSFGGG